MRVSSHVVILASQSIITQKNKHNMIIISHFYKIHIIIICIHLSMLCFLDVCLTFIIDDLLLNVCVSVFEISEIFAS